MRGGSGMAAIIQGLSRGQKYGRKYFPATGTLLRSARLADFVGHEHVFDGGENALLPVAWQRAHAVEKRLGFANRPGAALGRGLFAEQLVRGCFEDLGEFGEIVGAKGDGASFPTGVSLLGDAELVGDLGLGKSGALANGDQTFAELGTF